jgi:hypothetical protein
MSVCAMAVGSPRSMSELDSAHRMACTVRFLLLMVLIVDLLEKFMPALVSLHSASRDTLPAVAFPFDDSSL